METVGVFLAEKYWLGLHVHNFVLQLEFIILRISSSGEFITLSILLKPISLQ